MSNSDDNFVKIFIEAPSGERFEADIPRDAKLSKVAADFFEDRGWPTQDSWGRGQRAVVELVNPHNPEETKRLNGDLNIEDSNLRDGDTLRIFPESIAGCFLGQVMIALANGQGKLIRDIQVGDVLLSGIPDSKERTTTHVARIFKSVADSYLTLNGTLHVTESHPIWSNGEWIQAGKLKVGYKLQTVTGDYVYIRSIDQHQSKVDVWNLFVTWDEHTFFADDVLVHNMSTKEAIYEPDYLQHMYNLEEKVNELDSKLDQISRAFEALAKALRRIVVFRKVETNIETNVVIQIQIASDVQSFDRDKQANLIGSIAAHTEIPEEKIKLINIIEGSVLVTLEMPEDAALKLIKLYLGGNSFIIRELGIEKIELRPLLSLPRTEVPQLPPPEQKPIRILFLAANPLDTPQLRLGEEVRSIEQALRSAEFRDRYSSPLQFVGSLFY